MFEIYEGDIPVVRTRKALLILDLQNDFAASGGILPVDKPADYIEKINNVVPAFRSSGCIIWVRSQFETYRAVNDGSSTGDRVITDNEVISASRGNGQPGRRRGIPTKTLLKMYDTMLANQNDEEDDGQEAAVDSEEPYDNETYLTPELGNKPRCVIPLSLGGNFNPSILQNLDLSRDIFLTKTHYSAFKNTALLQTLRGQFVTELFICGALTNISVFATAMDAAQFGYAITLLEDCLGYRDKERHDEAIRQLVDTTGCDIISSLEVSENIRAKESAPNRSTDSRTPARESYDDHNLHSLITNLKLRNENSAAITQSEHPTGEVSDSRENLKSATQATSSHDSLLPEQLTSSDSLAEKLLPHTNVEGNNRKRVPNKIKTRRRPSKGQSNDTEGQNAGQLKPSTSESHKTAEAPLSPTHITLTSATEVLSKLSMSSPPDGTLLPPTKSTEQAESVAVSKTGNVTEQPVTKNMKNTVDEQETIRIEDCKKLVTSSSKSRTGHSISHETTQKEQESFPICDTYSEVIHNLLSRAEANDVFERVRDEVRWQKMSHQGGDVPRLVSVQGEIGEDGSIPIYRHPADESPPLLPFTPTVSSIRDEVERKLGHKVNHCLIQFYRNGTDYISEHSDKTLDIAPDTFIANVSLGALRFMTFRTKKPHRETKALNDEEKVPRMSCKIPLPHNSMCKMSLRTNMKWLHGIRQDKRATQEKSEAELAYDMGRISLTFRLIGTFLDRSQTKIWGQGATAKEKNDARSVTNGGSAQSKTMLLAFGKENHASDFDWQEVYGEGFDVLHIQSQRKLFLSGDAVADLRVEIMLSEFELDWSIGQLSPFFYWKQGQPHVDVPEVPEDFPVRIVDNDLSRARAQGDLAILLYLDASYGTSQDTKSQVQKARQYTRLQEANEVLQNWRAKQFNVKQFKRLLALWDIYASEDVFISGPSPSVADYAFWPVLHEVMSEWEKITDSPNLQAYYDRMLYRKSVQKVIVGVPGTS